ncbi:MAG: GH116 family glycosyl hydrolase [Verrucomicrobiota bacterium]
MKSLFTRGTPQVYAGSDLKYIGMPIGGIGCGQLYLGGNGKLWYWNVFNKIKNDFFCDCGGSHYSKPVIPSSPVEQGFTIRYGNMTLPLEKFSDITFRGEYPIGVVTYRDVNLPVSLMLEAFSPFIPLNTDDSCLPATVLQFTLKNSSNAKIEIELAGHLSKTGMDSRLMRGNGLTFLECSSSTAVDSSQPDHGTMGLAILDATKTASGELALSRTLSIDPGRSEVVTFLVTWHFPNLRIDKLPAAGRWYATKFKSALEVAEYVVENFSRLAGQTKLWRDTWYDSTLPYWFLDRTMANTSILATNTSFRFPNNRFYAWEGENSGPGTCTSVWYYAQAVARLFPELERSVREMQDFADGIGFDPTTGGIWTRAESRGDFVLDGQAGNVLRAYREHQMSANDAFLKRNWPKIKQATEWLIAQDKNGDGIIEGWQSTTLDCGSWWGAMSWTSLLYQAALRAGVEMAGELGDKEFPAKLQPILDVGSKNLTKRLWNGEYFFHIPDPSHENSFVLGNGCHIDQVYGQAWADQVGLGYLLPQKYVRSALRSLWKYNFTTDVGPYRKKFPEGRWYAMPGEGGMIMTTWPHNDRIYPKKMEAGMKQGVGYLNECMSGFEHQIAGHMISEGMVMEGLAVERTIHDRYHAAKRNPWNEIECGDFYSRAMASYGVFLAACGFEHHGSKGYIGFAPKLTPENFKCAFTTAEGWGSFSQKAESGNRIAAITLRWGRFNLKTIMLESKLAHSAKVSHDGKPVDAKLKREGKRVLLTLKNPATISAGEKFEITLT